MSRPKRPRSRKKRRRRRPTREEIKERRRKYRAARAALRNRELTEGLVNATHPALPNRKSGHETVEEERAERERIATRFLDAIRPQWPALLDALSKIADFRNPRKVEHQLTLVLFYGILCFVLQMASRREANRELTGPMLREHLRKLFPDLETLPHQDTLNRILSHIEVEKIQDAHLQMVKRLIANKKFDRFLINGRYPIAVDGTQKLVRQDQVSPEWLERRINKGKDTERTQYYVYVLEASLAFANGLTLPVLTEFLNYTEGDTSNEKQDCESRAFHRLARRLKQTFPRLPILLLLDGLYPNGPIMAACRKNHWNFMIVLQDESLPSVWEEYKGLKKLETKNQATMTWGNRRQHFQWVNDIEYRYGTNQKKRLALHVVVCTEEWDELNKETGKIERKTSRHAWISSEPLNKGNLHERCNLGARHRWDIEEQNLVEKKHGYQYEHCFSYDWNAMKGYHYLMHLGHALNVLAQYSDALIDSVRQKGVRGLIRYIRDTLVHPWLSPERLHERLNPNPQLRLA